MATFNGTSGSDFLFGTTGADTLSGGAGNDTYFVNNAADVVVESFNGGNDRVYSSITYALTANVEALTLTGSAALDGTGNALNNTLVGNSGANRLDGGAGADSMAGGAGNDLYIVDNVGDSVIENANEGTDTVQSSVSLTLAANVENLMLTGSAAINGTGNGLDNVITGNAMRNTLSGGGGNDILTGAGGDDSIDGGSGFDTAVYSGAGSDYRVTFSGTTLTIADLRAGATDGVDTIANVEAIRFADYTAYLDGRNNAPYATADAVSTKQNTALVISAATLLANDVDPEGSALRIVSVSNGSHGSAVLNANGTITYRPTSGYSGADSFNYTVSDGSLTATAKVNVTITGQSAPVAVNDTASGNEDAAIVTGNVLANDTDADSALTASSITGYSQGAHGTVAYNNNGTFTYAPTANFNGADSFTYTVSDGTQTSMATVNITVNAVNDAPVAAGDSASGNEDTAIKTGNVLSNDADVDNTLTATSIVGNTNGAHGTVVYNNDGTFTYTPTADFNGTDSFTYTVSDGALSSTATVNVTVNAVNDAPVAASDSASGNEDTAIKTGNVLSNDTDVDNTLTAASIVGNTNGAHGTVIYNNDGTFTYTPTANFNGTDSFTYTISDGALSSTATVNVTVNAVNDAPVATADSASGNEDTAIRTGNVLSNDTDVDNTLTAASIVGNTNGAHGTVAYNNDGTFTYTPTADFNGTDSFTYTVSDGALSSTATVNVTVNAVNDAPILAGDSVTGSEDTAIRTGNVLANDSDVDGPLSASSITSYTGGAHGSVVYNNDGTFTYTPTTNFNGTDVFTYTVRDGAFTSTSTVDVTVDAVNDAPTVRPHTNLDPAQYDQVVEAARSQSPGFLPINLDDIALGHGGFKIVGEHAGDAAGYAVVSSGDINGDGLSDVWVASHHVRPDGGWDPSIYIVYSKTDGSVVNLADVGAGIGGYKISGMTGAGSGPTVLGDVNGDRYTDYVIAGDGSGNPAGTAYVLFGKGFDGSHATTAEVDAGTGGYKIIGMSAGDATGTAVSAAGDVNGDGRADLIVSAPGNDLGSSDSGATYVLFGKPDTTTVDLQLLTHFPQALGGYMIYGERPGDQSGMSASGGGDMNGDGRPDLIIGAPGNDTAGTDAGAAYVVFSPSDDSAGDPTAAGNVLMNEIDPEGDSFSIAGVQSGTSAAPIATGVGATIAGQYGSLVLNADGAWLYTLNNANPATNALGQFEQAHDVFSYTVRDSGGAQATTTLTVDIFGMADAVSLKGTAGADTLTGTGMSDTLSGGAGDDVLIGGFRADTLTGGEGSDHFRWTNWAETGNDLITDFTPGVGGDALDLRDVLRAVGYVDGTSATSNYVRLVEVTGSATDVEVDLGGNGFRYSYETYATLQGVTGVTVEDMLSQGNLLI